MEEGLAMKKFSKVKGLFVSVLLLVLFVGCGAPKKEIPNEKNLETVDVILDWYPNALYSFIYVAMEKGYFEEEGIKVNIHFPSNASDPLALTAAKKADIGFYFLHHLVMARVNENIPVKSIGVVVQKPLSVVMSLKENNITRPKDLEGKLVGYSGGPLTEGTIHSMMINDGGDPSKVEVLDIGFELLTGMITKKVDATIGGLINHEVPVMKEKGFEINYFYPSEYGVPDYYENLLVANEDLIEERKDVYKRFLKACVKGAEEMRKNPEGSLDILLSKQEAEQFPLSRNVERQSTEILLSKMFIEGTPFLHQENSVWQKNIDWLYENKIINRKADASEMFINLYEEGK